MTDTILLRLIVTKLQQAQPFPSRPRTGWGFCLTRVEANNVQAEKLAEENHAKIAQNVAAGVVGVSFGRFGSPWMQKASRVRRWMPSRRGSNT